MRAPDTVLGGAAATAARWPEIGQPAEQNMDWIWLLDSRGCTHACRAWGLLGPGMNWPFHAKKN